MAHPMGESKREGRRAGPGQEHRPRGVVRQRYKVERLFAEPLVFRIPQVGKPHRPKVGLGSIADMQRR